MSALFSKNLA